MLLDEFVTSKVYREITENVCRNNELKDDLHSEAIMVIIEKNFDLSEIRNPIHFFASVVWKTWMSNKFRKKYFKKEAPISEIFVSRYHRDEQIDFEETKDCADDNVYCRSLISKEITFKAITGFIWEDYKSDIEYYEKNLLRLYLEEGDCKKVSNRTKIPHRTVVDDIRNIKNKLKKLHNEENSD